MIFLFFLLAMEIVINPEKKGYSAHIPDLQLSTEWENFDELIQNIKEAIELYYDEEKEFQKKKFLTNKFYLNMSHLAHAT